MQNEDYLLRDLEGADVYCWQKGESLKRAVSDREKGSLML